MQIKYKTNYQSHSHSLQVGLFTTLALSCSEHSH